MKKVLTLTLLIAAMVLIATPSYALFNGPVTNNEGGNGYGGKGGSARSCSDADARAAALAASCSEATAIGVQATKVKVDGDNIESENLAIAYGHAAANPSDGDVSASFGSFLGGISWTEASEIKRIKERAAFEASFDKDGKIDTDIADELRADMKRVTKPKRYLFILWKTSGRRHLLNLFGLLEGNLW